MPFGRGGGTREAGSTVAESLVASALPGGYAPDSGDGGGKVDRRRARGVQNPCALEPMAQTGRFLREKLISDRGHFSSYEGQHGAPNEQILWAFSGMHGALDGWVLTRAPASPARGLHHHWPRYFNFLNFYMPFGLEKLGLVDQN